MFLPSAEDISSLRNFTPEDPLRLMVSACLSGEKCGVDGSSYGEYPWILNLMKMPNVRASVFCPEQFSFGTPREMPDIHGGNGFDVLDGKAKVFTDKGKDWTTGMITAAHEMLKMAKTQEIELAILTDMSAACGTQVISDGNRLIENRKYQKGPGVCAALLIRAGIKVVSQRDFKTLELITRKLDRHHQVQSNSVDHHETEWYVSYFNAR